MNQIENTFQIFAKTLGFDHLNFNDKGTIAISIDSIGQLYFEKNSKDVWIYLARAIPYIQNRHLIRALEMVHPRETLPLPIKCALHKNNQLLFATCINEDACDLPTLEQAITALRKLHDNLQS